MLVKELKELLEQYDDNDIIVIAVSDEDFSPVDIAEVGYYIPLNEDLGDFISTEETEDDENINLEDSIKAIALYPII